MARRKFNPLARIGKAFQSFWRTLSEPESETREPQEIVPPIGGARRPLPPRPFGVPAPQPRQPKTPPQDNIDHGAPFDWDNDNAHYPEHWGSDEIAIWNSEPGTYSSFYTDEEYEMLQEVFENGWLATRNHPNTGLRKDFTKEQREGYRQDFYDISGATPASFDWAGFREYLNEVGSPTIT